jgi:hypothetical protein
MYLSHFGSFEGMAAVRRKEPCLHGQQRLLCMFNRAVYIALQIYNLDVFTCMCLCLPESHSEHFTTSHCRFIKQKIPRYKLD